MTPKVFSVFVSFIALCLFYGISFAAGDTGSIKIQLVVVEPALSKTCNIHLSANQIKLNTTFRQNCRIDTMALLNIVTQFASKKNVLANTEQPVRVTMTAP